MTDAMRAAELGTDNIDGNVQDLPIWNFYRKDFPNLKPVGPPVGRGFYVALLRKSDRQLLDSVNEAINVGLRDGRLRAIFERYGMWNDVQGMRALETSADGGFRGMVKSEESNSAATTEGGSDSEATNKPELSSSQSLHGLKVITQRGWFLVRAALMTVLLSITAMPLAVLIGLMMALMKLYGKWFVSIPATCYVELVRGTPLVLQLYVIYFLVP